MSPSMSVTALWPHRQARKLGQIGLFLLDKQQKMLERPDTNTQLSVHVTQLIMPQWHAWYMPWHVSNPSGLVSCCWKQIICRYSLKAHPHAHAHAKRHCHKQPVVLAASHQTGIAAQGLGQ